MPRGRRRIGYRSAVTVRLLRSLTQWEAKHGQAAVLLPVAAKAAADTRAGFGKAAFTLRPPRVLPTAEGSIGNSRTSHMIITRTGEWPGIPYFLSTISMIG